MVPLLPQFGSMNIDSGVEPDGASNVNLTVVPVDYRVYTRVPNRKRGLQMVMARVSVHRLALTLKHSIFKGLIHYGKESLRTGFR